MILSINYGFCLENELFWGCEMEKLESLRTERLTKKYTRLVSCINHQLHKDWIQYQAAHPELRSYIRTWDVVYPKSSYKISLSLYNGFLNSSDMYPATSIKNKTCTKCSSFSENLTTLHNGQVKKPSTKIIIIIINI